LGLGLSCLVSLGLGGCMAEYVPPDDTPVASNELALFDPFTSDMPALLLDAWVRQNNGRLLHIAMQSDLYDYGIANTTDPRPWLLLAYDSVARDWDGIAIRQYGLALKADARVTRTENVLADVLRIAIDYTGVVEETDANALLTQYWGVAALPAIDSAQAEMEAEGHDAAAKKLEAMRRSLIAGARAQ
jgi:hypothetical protein